MDRNEVLAGLKKAKGFFEARADMAVGEGKMLLLSWANAQAEAIELLKAQEPRVLQIKEMAFLAFRRYGDSDDCDMPLEQCANWRRIYSGRKK